MNAINYGLNSALAGGTALISLLGGTAIYHGQAPESASLPYVVFSQQGGGPENTHADDARDLLYFVRGYATTGKAAGDIDDAISALLHRKSITVSGWRNFWLARETDYEFVETTATGGLIFTAGGIYRIRIV